MILRSAVVFQDLFQAGIGACKIEEIALSVLTSIISKQPNRNRIIIDAAGLALSKDRSTQGREFDAGFGVVCGANSGEQIEDLLVVDVSPELGLVTSASGRPINFDGFQIGQRLRILPNHACMTAAAHGKYYVFQEDTCNIEIWDRVNGW